MKSPTLPPTATITFDVEEHYRIEAAAGLTCNANQQLDYRQRAEKTTRQLLQILDNASCQATFFIVGELAVQCPRLIREIHQAGHEIASHGWDHRPVTRLTPPEFKIDITRSKETLEQITGYPVYGYRAPTFSILRKTAWAIDILLEAGYLYDSSIFPVRHDRYGVPDAPTKPFRCSGSRAGPSIMELPPLTLPAFFTNLPIAGGGYFRLFPLWVLQSGILFNQRQTPSVSMLYFHPWEFEPGQPKLPLKGIHRWRTYVGIPRAAARLKQLLKSNCTTRFRRAIDVVNELSDCPLSHFQLNDETSVTSTNPIQSLPQSA